MIAYSGTYRYFCELDMQEMLRIKDLRDKKKKINAIDLDAVFAMYSFRQTFFSIYEKDMKLLKQILAAFEAKNFEHKEDKDL